jgi:hypothetical protein
MPERELTNPYSLAGADGRLNADAVGWSRHPLCDATLSRARGRRKRWNYWSLHSHDVYFVVAVVDVDYMRLVFAQLLTLPDLVWSEGRLTLPVVARPRMGGRVDGDVVFRWGRTHIEMLSREGGTDVRVDWPSFPGGGLRADLHAGLSLGQESINVTIPWSAKRYHFTSKQPATPATGTLRVGDVTYGLDGLASACAPGSGQGGSDCFAALDFARGIWRYDSAWDWMTVSGRDTRNRIVGLNLGAGWTDGTSMTENGVVLDGIAHKIGQTVKFEYDPRDLMRPWRVRSDDGETVDIRVAPFYHHRLNTDLGILRSKLDQVFGRVSGTVVLPGDTVELDGPVAMCENQKARW